MCIPSMRENNLYRSSRPEVLCKEDILRNFARLTGKHLCQSLLFNKAGGLQLYQKRNSVTWFSREFSEISKNTYGCCFCL